MRTVWAFVGFVGCVIGTPAPGFAQTDVEPVPLAAQPVGSGFEILPASHDTGLQRRAQLERWVTEFSTWMEWRDEWLNKPEPGWLGDRNRRQKPSPPDWLFDECLQAGRQDSERLDEACRLVSAWNDDYATWQVRQQIAAERAQLEAPTKSRWWQHAHIDGFWPMTEFRTRVYGVIGIHATVEVAGRFQVFIAPGAILLNLPTAQGTREWKPATDWGVAYRLFDFKFPGTGQPASLHINLAKAWVLANSGNLPLKSSIDLAGFSVTFKPKR
jgi:hypothetical protein